MTLQELYRELERHDWFHEMSDDHSVWQRGENNWGRLTAAAKSIPGGTKLQEAFVAHYYSGDPWKTEKKPKPQFPQEPAK